MGRVSGIALLVLAAFMLFGSIGTIRKKPGSIGEPKTIFAVLIAVALPAVGGVALLRGGLGSGNRDRRLAQLRQQTIEAEILRMAVKENGRLTAVEVATALALPQESVKETLDAMVTRDVADIAVSDQGVIVYTFHDAKHIGGKDSAKGVLDA